MFLIQNPNTEQTGICKVQVSIEKNVQWIPLNGNFTQLTMIDSDLAFLIDSNQSVSILQGDTLKEIEAFSSDSDHPPKIIPISSSENAPNAIIIVHYGENCNLYYCNTQNQKEFHPFAVGLTNIAAPICAALTLDNTGLLLLEDGSTTKVRYIPFSLSQKTSAKIQINLQESYSISLPKIKKVKTIKFITPKDCIILENSGKLWSMSIDQQHPVAITHSEWKNSKDTLISVGSNSWCSVWFNNKLSMWRIRKGGRVYRYIETPFLEVSELREPALTTTSNGRYLVAGINQRIAVWRYPEYDFHGGKLGKY